MVEGVEKEEQAEWLRASGCGLLQGFLFGRPGPHRKQNQPI
ncbi:MULTISPECIES: EAL domain-containing protein [Erwiniaceae]|nr:MULTISPECIES: EAL domain-containing protein [Erwiniaceae]